MKLFTIIVFIFIIVFVPLSFGENIDLIVMVDISASMEPYFDDVVSYFLNDLLANNINSGDDFYFLIFSSNTERYGDLNINDDPASVELVINKIKLTQPIALHTDLVNAVQSLYNFSSSLPQERPKLILLLTDGIHDPPPESKYNIESSEVEQIMGRIGRNMKKDNWVFKIIKFPMDINESALSNNSESADNKTNYLDILAEESESKIIEYNSGDNDSLTLIESEIPDLRNNNSEEDENISNLESENDINVDITTMIINLALNPVFILVIVILIVLIIVVIIIYNKKTKSTVSKVIKKTSAKKKRKGKSQQIEMRVQTQNPKIGFRNIHQIGKDHYKKVGGGKSAFLIYFIKFPSNIAEIHWDGKNFTFIPVKTVFFPELKGKLKKCLNKDIHALSKKGHRIIINFYEYISPLEKINSIFKKVLSSYY